MLRKKMRLAIKKVHNVNFLIIRFSVLRKVKSRIVICFYEKKLQQDLKMKLRIHMEVGRNFKLETLESNLRTKRTNENMGISVILMDKGSILLNSYTVPAA